MSCQKTKGKKNLKNYARSSSVVSSPPLGIAAFDIIITSAAALTSWCGTMTPFAPEIVFAK
jgi:hypothetical protein